MGINLRPDICLCLLILVHLGFAQYPFDLKGGQNHSVASAITCTFSTAVRSRTLLWNINGEEICRVLVEYNTVVYSGCPGTSYYNNNSIVIKAEVNAGLLETEFEYQNIKLESGRSILSISDKDAGGTLTTLNQTDFIAKFCPNQTNADYEADGGCGRGYNTFNCTSLFYCSDGYNGSNINATCQADASWSSEVTCTKVTCNITSSGWCHDNGTTFAGSLIDFGQTLVCCSDSNQSFTCGNGSEIDSDQKCSAQTPTPEITTTPETKSQTVPTSNTTQPDGLSEWQIVAICYAVIFLALGIAVIVITCTKHALVNNYNLGIYIVSSVLAISGIIMAAAGNNGVEIAGVVLGTLGLVGMLGGLEWQCIVGKESSG